MPQNWVRPKLGYSFGDSLIQPMFIIGILLVQPKGYLEHCNYVGPKALLSPSVGFELAEQDQLWATDRKVDPLSGVTGRTITRAVPQTISDHLVWFLIG